METRVARWPVWFVALGVAGAYFATARLGLSLAFPPGYKATAVWPPSGIALAALLLGLRLWPGVWLGAFAAEVWDVFAPSHSGSFSAHVVSSAVIATGSTLQALAGTALVNRFVGPGGVLERARDAFRFVAVIPVACLIGATVGATALSATGLAPWSAAPTVWWTWWIGDVVGALVLAPAVLCAARCERFPRPSAEAVVLFTLLFCSCAAVFGGWGHPAARSAPLAYLSLPFLVWATIRFGPQGAALAVVVIAALAVRGTVHGTGPFAHTDVRQALLLLDGFLAVVVATSLVLGAVLRERETAEAALRASETRFRQLTEALPQIVWAASTSGATVYLNRRWAEYTGLDGVGPDDLARVVHPDDLPRLAAAGAVAQRTGGPLQEEFRLRPANGGAYRWFLARSVPVPGPDGTPDGRLGTSTDIDDLKRAQAELARQRAELQLILDTVPALIFYKDRAHRLVRVNNEVVRRIGLPHESIVGRTDSELGSPHADDYRRHEEEIMREGAAPRTVTEPLHTFAGTRWLQTTKLPYRDATGRVAGILGLSVDITDQKQAEEEVRRLNAELERRVAERTAVAEARAVELQRAVEALRDQKQLLRTVLDSLGEAVLVAGKDGRILLQNRAFQQLHPGVTEPATHADLARLHGVYLPDGSAPCPAHQLPIVRALRGEPCDHVDLLVIGAGHPGGVPISVTGRPILGPNGVEGGVIAIRDVSAARRSEAALWASEARFRAIFDQTFQFIGLLDTSGTVLEANQTALAAAGVSEGDVIGRPFWETRWWTHDPVQQDRLRGAVRLAVAGETVRFEATHPAPDGQRIWVDFSLKPFRDAAGNVTLLIPEGRDITNVKRAVEALEATDALLRQFIKYAPAAIAMLDTQMRYVRASDRWVSDYHLADRNIIGRSHYEVFPDAPDRWKGIHQRVLAGAVEACAEDPFLRADGSTEWLQWECRPWRAAGGEVGGLIMFTQVITDRIHAAEALRESEDRFRGAFDHAPIGIALVSPEGRWLKVNQSMCQMLGYSADELLVTDFQTITYPDDLNADLALVGQVLSGARATYQMEKRYFHKTGHVIYVRLAVSLVRGTRGEPRYFVSQVEDITEWKRTEHALRASEERFRVLFDYSSDAHLIFDEASGILDCNRAAVAMLRCTDKAEVLALHPAVLSPDVQPDGRRSLEKCVEMDAAARRNGYHRFDWLHRRMDGEEFPCEVTLTPVVLDGSTVLLTVWHDLTERKRGEEQVLTALREKEVMLKEIHHRVKNNLQIISTLLELQGDGLTDPAAVAAFRESRSRVRSMSLIHERLYRSENLASVEFGSYLRGLTEDLFRAYRADDEAIRLRVEVSAPPLPLDVAIPCGLLVNELISNCLKYAFTGREGGIISVSLDRAGLGALVLTVADDGVGLPPGFDLRNTSSFGLQLVGTLVAQLRGELELGNGPGARFAVRFPSREPIA